MAHTTSERPAAEPRRAADPAASLSVPDLVTKLFRDVSELFRMEGQLIRAEMNDKLTQLQAGIGKIAAGAIVLLVALIVLTNALVIGVAELIGTVERTADNTGWAALIVGAIYAVIGAFLVRSGVSDLNPENLKPDRTAHQVRRDAELAREQVR
jgi:hypothetical protein